MVARMAGRKEGRTAGIIELLLESSYVVERNEVKFKEDRFKGDLGSR